MRNKHIKATFFKFIHISDINFPMGEGISGEGCIFRLTMGVILRRSFPGKLPRSRNTPSTTKTWCPFMLVLAMSAHKFKLRKMLRGKFVGDVSWWCLRHPQRQNSPLYGFPDCDQLIN